MFSSSYRITIAAALLFGITLASVTPVAADDSVQRAYRLLESRGLLKKAAPSQALTDFHVVERIHAPLAAPAPALESAAAIPAPSVKMAETKVLPRAYQVLQSLGLLSVETAAVPQKFTSSAIADRVMVDKSERKLYLLKNGRSIREFPVRLGRQPSGHKKQAGDLRTPEGVYTLDWRNPRSRFHKSIHISYPSDSDVQQAERLGVDPGGMIMIHGEHYIPAFRELYRRASNADWTDGCIALRNDQMDELWHHVADGTLIEIRP